MHPAPSLLPTRRPGKNWLSHGSGASAPTGTFAIVVLSAAGAPVEVLAGTWPTARTADTHVRTLPRDAEYRVVPCRSTGT